MKTNRESTPVAFTPDEIAALSPEARAVWNAGWAMGRTRGRESGLSQGRRQGALITGAAAVLLAAVSVFTVKQVGADRAPLAIGCDVVAHSGQTGWDIAQGITTAMGSAAGPDEILAVEDNLARTVDNPPSIIDNVTHAAFIPRQYCGDAREAFPGQYDADYPQHGHQPEQG